ncbi:MAG: hypothetical protein WD052_02115 [Bacteroidales bacterium]
MNKEKLVELIRTETFTEEHFRQLDELIREYPSFGLPRFYRLKAAHQLGKDVEPADINKTVIFSYDRKHLYNWIRGEEGGRADLSGIGRSELEFLDSDPGEMHREDAAGESVLTLDAEDDQGDDAHEKAIPEKEETEMEEPETEEDIAIPSIDTLDEEEQGDEIREVNEEQDSKTEDREIETRDAAEKVPERHTRKESGTTNHSSELIQQFLSNEPGVIRADKETSLEGDISEESIKEDDSYITDTLAKIYVKQGLHAKAIYAYERLSLKYPEKSAYFAAQIEKIKSISNL